MLKTIFVPEIFTILLCIFGYVEKRLDKKALVNFKIYILSYISRSKRNQAMEFGQVIKYSVKNIVF